MDTKKISAFLAIVRSGSLTAAAEELGYTQPGLTNLMKALEDEMGLKLLVRSKSGVRLSEAGSALIGGMQTLVDASNTLEKSAAALREKKSNTFHVGAIASAARNWLPLIAEAFKAESPYADLYITRHDNLNDTYEAVKRGDLDCAIISYKSELMNNLDWTPLKDDEMVAILPGNAGYAESSYPVRLFEGKQFFMLSGGFDVDVVHIFEETGTSPDIRYSNLDDHAVLSMVSHALGTTIASRLIVSGISENISAVSLDPPFYRRLGIICKTDRKKDKNITKFINVAQEILNES